MNTVLVVDDDCDLLNLYVDFLEEMGFQVASTQDGVNALRLAVELKPDLIITDWQMPGMDGIELCKALRQSLPPGSTRIILHSSESVPESGGADMCLRKPSSFEAFKTVVEALLGGPRKRDEDSAPRAPVRVLPQKKPWMRAFSRSMGDRHSRASDRPTGFVASKEGRFADGELVGLRLAPGAVEEGERQRSCFRERPLRQPGAIGEVDDQGLGLERTGPGPNGLLPCPDERANDFGLRLWRFLEEFNQRLAEPVGRFACRTRHQPRLYRREDLPPALDQLVDDVEQRPFAERLEVERVEELLERSLLRVPSRERSLVIRVETCQSFREFHQGPEGTGLTVVSTGGDAVREPT
ncbi:response regulator [Corallococcus exiguus]|uniref:response regulator n=1 Tax=Corallococcus exiguus TaxID=83462 RepID=UPI001F5F21B8|nr:response regulator [Corallococcus exiguus]